MALKVNSIDININLPNIAKIEKMLNDQSYNDLIEFSANFNTRLCVERKLRMPFLDPQTGVAQNHSNLFMRKTQRIPGIRDGQIYTYPSSRWRTTRKRQYLSNANSYPFNYRPFGRFRDAEFDHLPPQVGEHFVPEEPTFRPTVTEDSHSKDSHQDGSKTGWYYDEMDIHDMDTFDEPEEDSDDDFMEPRSGRKKRSVGRTPSSASRRSGKERDTDSRRGRTSNSRGGRGRKVNPPQMVDNSSNSSDKFNEYSRRRSVNPPQVTTTHNLNPMSFDEAIPEHKIPTTERGKTHFDEERMTLMSTASTSSVGITAAFLGASSKMSTVERNEKPRANPSTYCDFCLGDARENKKTGVSEV